MAAERRVQRTGRSLRWRETAAYGWLRVVMARWWANPLLRHARRQAPLPVRRVRTGILVGAAVVAALSIFAWVTGSRALGAVLIGLSLGAVVSPALIAAPAGADRIARDIRFSRKDPRRLVDVEPPEIAWGLALVTLWRLRWLIVVGLALTPALVIGVLRIDVADYVSWQSSREVMAQGTSPASEMLRSDGGIPYFRLAVRALSAGVTPWAALLLAASLGVLMALALRDLTLSPLAALVSEMPVILIVGGLWSLITRTPALAGGLEIVRVLAIAGVWAGVVGAVVLMNQMSARLLGMNLVSEQPDGEEASPGSSLDDTP